MTSAYLLGDSQAGGIADPLGALLRARGWTTIGAAHTDGGSTHEIIDNGSLGRALAARPAVLVVFAGGNDGASAQGSWGNVVDTAHRLGTRVVWIGPPAAIGNDALDTRRRTVSRAQQAFFATKPWVKWIDGRRTANGLPRRDEVHLTIPVGYASWAQRLAPEISSSSGGAATIGIAAAVLLGAWWIANKASGLRGLDAYLASDAQRRYAQRLANEARSHGYAIGHTISDRMTSEQASALIDRLKAAKARGWTQDARHAEPERVSFTHADGRRGTVLARLWSAYSAKHPDATRD